VERASIVVVKADVESTGISARIKRQLFAAMADMLFGSRVEKLLFGLRYNGIKSIIVKFPVDTFTIHIFVSHLVYRNVPSRKL
jgi:hypothetical protein